MLVEVVALVLVFLVNVWCLPRLTQWHGAHKIGKQLSLHQRSQLESGRREVEETESQWDYGESHSHEEMNPGWAEGLVEEGKLLEVADGSRSHGVVYPGKGVGNRSRESRIQQTESKETEETNHGGVEEGRGGVRSKEKRQGEGRESSGCHGDPGMLLGTIETERRLGDAGTQLKGQVSRYNQSGGRQWETHKDGQPVARERTKLKQKRTQSPKVHVRAKPGADNEELGSRERQVSANVYLEAFRCHSGDLITIIQDPEVLAWQLFGQYVLSSTVVEEVCMPTLAPIQRKTRLLAAVRDQIAVDSAALAKFLLVLKMQPYLMDMAQRLERTYLSK